MQDRPNAFWVRAAGSAESVRQSTAAMMVRRSDEAAPGQRFCDDHPGSQKGRVSGSLDHEKG